MKKNHTMQNKQRVLITHVIRPCTPSDGGSRSKPHYCLYQGVKKLTKDKRTKTKLGEILNGSFKIATDLLKSLKVDCSQLNQFNIQKCQQNAKAQICEIYQQNQNQIWTKYRENTNIQDQNEIQNLKVYVDDMILTNKLTWELGPKRSNLKKMIKKNKQNQQQVSTLVQTGTTNEIEFSPQMGWNEQSIRHQASQVGNLHEINEFLQDSHISSISMMPFSNFPLSQKWEFGIFGGRNNQQLNETYKFQNIGLSFHSENSEFSEFNPFSEGF